MFIQALRCCQNCTLINQPLFALSPPSMSHYFASYIKEPFSVCYLGKDRDLCKLFVSLDTNTLIIVSLQSLLLFVRQWH